MAIKKVKLPNNTVQDINDARVVSDAIVYYGSDEGSATNVDTQYEETANKVTSMSSSSTNTQYPSAKAVYDALATKQATLVSGTNIKTVNNQSLLGSGNITIQGGGGGGSDIFFATYGTTTGTEIYSAKNSGKIPVVIYNNCLYTLVKQTAPDDYFYFEAFTISSNSVDPNDIVHKWVKTTDDSVANWSAGSELTISPNLFIATYGTTTGAQIASAISDGKMVVVWYNNVLYQLSYTWHGDDSYHFDAFYYDTTYGSIVHSTVSVDELGASWNTPVTEVLTSDCVHKTGDETVGGDKTFTDDIIVGGASNIKYSGGGGGGGFTRGTATKAGTGTTSISFTGLSGEPKAFFINLIGVGSGVLMIVGDSSGLHGIYNTGSQHNYSAGFSKSYSNGTLTITAPTGVTFASGSNYGITYYYGDSTLTFKTSTIQPGSGVTAVTFTGTGLTEIPAMYACFLESAVNNEQYRRVAGVTNSGNDDGAAPVLVANTFVTGGVENTSNSFSVSYNNGLYINSGGQNAGGYFHNPGTYTLYYLMASDVASGGGSGYQTLGDELDDIRDTISGIETLLAAI